MAHIKCRYYGYICGCGVYGYSGHRCEYPADGNGCEYFKDHWFDEGKNMWAISEVCAHACRSHNEFEGDYRKYEVDDFELHIPRRYIDMDRIEYLEVDGRVIVDRSSV